MNLPLLSSQENETNCPGTQVNISSVSIMSSIVVGFKYFFEMTRAPWVATSIPSSHTTKSDRVTPQIGHRQSAGISRKSVPGVIPLSSSQRAGSYIYPHGTQSHFFPRGCSDFLTNDIPFHSHTFSQKYTHIMITGPISQCLAIFRMTT